MVRPTVKSYSKKKFYKKKSNNKTSVVPYNPEWKAIDISDVSTPTDVGSAIILLNGLTKGTEVNQRVGRKFTMKSIDIKFGIHFATPFTPQTVRVLLLYDKAPNGSYPSLTQDVIVETGSVYAPFSSRNLEHMERMQCLMDRRYTLDTYGNGRIVDSYYKKGEWPVIFNGDNNGTISDICHGAIYWITYGDQAPAGNPGFFRFYSRIRFLDS